MNPLIQNATSRLFTAAALVGLLSVASAQDSPEHIPTTPFGSIPEPAISLAAKDWVALRAWFHQPQFNVSDGLDSYADEGHRSISTQQIAVISPLRTQ